MIGGFFIIFIVVVVVLKGDLPGSEGEGVPDDALVDAQVYLGVLAQALGGRLLEVVGTGELEEVGRGSVSGFEAVTFVEDTRQLHFRGIGQIISLMVIHQH